MLLVYKNGDILMTEMPRYSANKIVQTIEKRFLEVANLDGDLSIMPMPREHHLQVTTNQEKSNLFSEVFTPIWVVDEMLQRVSEIGRAHV